MSASDMLPSGGTPEKWVCWACMLVNKPPDTLYCAGCGVQRTGHIGNGVVIVGPKVAAVLRKVMNRG